MRIDIDDYADTNCYHVRETSSTNGHCTSPIKNRASYNSWEINSDRSCMSRGKTNSFECGWIREENFNSTNYVRVEIFSQGGDSGAGLLYAGTADGILVWHVDANNSAFMTTYYVQVELGNGYFYLNCAPTATTKTPSQWGSCPIVDR